jgi:hypothetical protein
MLKAEDSFGSSILILPLLFQTTISQLPQTQTLFIRLFPQFRVLRSSRGVSVFSTEWILDSVHNNCLVPTRSYLVQGIPPPTFSEYSPPEGSLLQTRSRFYGVL